MKARFELGNVVKDKITGFKGPVVAVSYYYTGCVHYGVAAAALKDGVPHDDSAWFSEPRLVLVKDGDSMGLLPGAEAEPEAEAEAAAPRRRGGPHPNPPGPRPR